MSLISDTDYLIHSLRLSYLRTVDDPYAARIISLDPAYTNNPYILAASLADSEKWPELARPSSPQLSDNESERPSGFPGATGLKHTQTIMGSRSGGMGIRVNGKRLSTSKRMSGTTLQQAELVKNFISEGTLSSTVPTTTTTTALVPDNNGSWNNHHKDDKVVAVAADVDVSVNVQGPIVHAEAPVKAVQFIPKFKGAAEMEARRRVRMQARRGPGAAEPPPPPPPPPISIDFSSSEEEEETFEDDDDTDDFGEADNESLNDGDDFDPDFAATRIPSDSASEIQSPMSADIPASSPAANAPSFLRPRTTTRLSPVSEHKGPRRDRSPRPPNPASDPTFEMLTPAVGSSRRPRPVPNQATKSNPPASASSSPIPAIPPASAPTPPQQISFPRRPIPAGGAAPPKSALSAMLASSSSSSTNPFAETYAAISGRGNAEPSAAMNVSVFFPLATGVFRNKAMELNVRRDASMEEVIGFALWSYWEEGWLPKLDEGMEEDGGDGEGEGEEEKRRRREREVRLSAVGWIMRIAEEDGEVDDEFPPPDRTGKISKFNFDAYAVLEANPAQVQQNQLLETKIQRRPSRSTTKKSASASALPTVAALQPTALLPPMATSAVFTSSSALGSVPLSTSLGPSSGYGPQIFLRIRVADTADAVHISTTIPVSAGMYMQEALELVCKKRKLQNPKDYALLLGDMSILIPLDRTVASLQGKRELVLVKRSMLNDLGGAVAKGIGKTNDPNASIFKRMSDVPVPQQYSSSLDYMDMYKKYTIYRKMPMLVARQERTLAIDGVYIRIMPSTNKPRAVFDNGKTSSYHIKSIADCEQSTKSSSIFKLVLNLPGGSKRYDFEAESAKLATEIVQAVKALKTALERSGTVSKARRSRQAV